MSFLDTYKKYVTSTGSSVKESMTKAFIDDANKLMKTNPSYFEVEISDHTDPVPSLIVDDSKNEDYKHISLAPNYPLKRGDYVIWDNKTWLVAIVDNQGDLYYRGRMILCSSEELKWVDSDGAIHSYPCVFHYGTKANFGTYFDKVMTLPDGRRQVTVQGNEHTRKIKRDMRFIFGGNVFRVIDHDYVSDEGLVNINLKDDQYNPAIDNMELGIADYYGRAPSYSIKILNGSYLSIAINQELQLNIEVLNNGEVVADPIVEYIYDSSMVDIDDQGLLTPKKIGSVHVVTKYNDSSAVIEINITSATVNNYTVDIVGSDFINQSMTKTYTAYFKNNGVEFSEVAQFHITDLNGANSSLAEIVSIENNSCEIKAGMMLGKVLLHVQNSNGLVRGSKEINIKSLI